MFDKLLAWQKFASTLLVFFFCSNKKYEKVKDEIEYGNVSGFE